MHFPIADTNPEVLGIFQPYPAVSLIPPPVMYITPEQHFAMCANITSTFEIILLPTRIICYRCRSSPDSSAVPTIATMRLFSQRPMSAKAKACLGQPYVVWCTPQPSAPV